MFEVVNGRLVGSKTWDLIVGIFGTHFGQFTDYLGGLCYNLCNKLWFGCGWAGNGHEFRFHKVEPMFGERAVHGQPTAHFGDC